MKQLLYIVLIGLLSYSCTPPLYIPNTTNTPTLKEKGDVDAAYSLGTNGHDLQAAYAITDNIGVMVNGSFGNSKSDSSNNFNKHSFLELGGGYTFDISDDKSKKILFSTFGGFGFGNAAGEYSFSYLTDNVYTNRVNGDYIRAFIQPSIGVSSDNVDFFFTLRTSFVNFSDITNELDQSIINNEYVNELGKLITPKKSNIFYEPTLTLRAGGKNVKGLIQLGFSKGSTPSIQTAFRQRPIIFLLGLHADLNLIK